LPGPVGKSVNEYADVMECPLAPDHIGFFVSMNINACRSCAADSEAERSTIMNRKYGLRFQTLRLASITALIVSIPTTADATNDAPASP